MVSFCKLLNAPADRMVKKLLNRIFRHYLALHAFSRNIDMSPKLRKRAQKSKNQHRFSVSVCCHFIPLVSRLGQRGPSMFGNMLKRNQRHEACKVSARCQEPCFAMTRLSDLHSLGRYCGLKFQQQIFGWIRKSPCPFRVK